MMFPISSFKELVYAHDEVNYASKFINYADILFLGIWREL